MRWLIFAAVVVCATWAAASDLQEKVSAAGTDGLLELAWDNGTQSYMLVWYTGPHNWVGVDFDISMIQSYRRIDTVRVYSRAAWPNGVWDGFRVGVVSMVGSMPGSLLWGPTWIRGSGTTSTWVDAHADFTLPAGTNGFLVGMTQYYSHPNCDPYAVDNNPTFTNHSWSQYGTTWSAYTNGGINYRNLMIRAVVDTVTAVEPASLGRVKATYF